MNKVLKELLSTGLYLLGVLCVTYLLILYVIQLTNVDGESMEPTLHDGDRVFVDKITYQIDDPERFDVIVFPVQYEEEKYFIKRIIGLPGETVQIDTNGVIYINGEVLLESFGKEVIQADKIGLAAEPIVLGEDEYFVLGDNRNDSFDSRYAQVGNISRDDIIGRTWLLIWPLSDFGFVKHD